MLSRIYQVINVQSTGYRQSLRYQEQYNSPPAAAREVLTPPKTCIFSVDEDHRGTPTFALPQASHVSVPSPTNHRVSNHRDKQPTNRQKKQTLPRSGSFRQLAGNRTGPKSIRSSCIPPAPLMQVNNTKVMRYNPKHPNSPPNMESSAIPQSRHPELDSNTVQLSVSLQHALMYKSCRSVNSHGDQRQITNSKPITLRRIASTQNTILASGTALPCLLCRF